MPLEKIGRPFLCPKRKESSSKHPFFRCLKTVSFCNPVIPRIIEASPIPSKYGIFTYIWLISMGIFTYIYHRNQPNVGKYIIHGWYGSCNSYMKSQTSSGKGIQPSRHAALWPGKLCWENKQFLLHQGSLCQLPVHGGVAQQKLQIRIGDFSGRIF